MRRLVVLGILACSGLMTAGCVDDPNDPKTWIKKLDDVREQKDAVRELVKINDPSAVEPLIKLYNKSKDPEHLRAIAHFKDKRALQTMIDSLDYSEDSFDNASIAATALGDIPDSSSVEPLIKVLKKPLPIKTRANVVKLEAMKSLAKIKDKRAVDALISVLSTSADEQDFFLNKVAAVSLAKFADPKAVPALVRGMFMVGRGANIFPECRTGLIAIGEPAVGALVEAMQRKNKDLEADAKKFEFIPGVIVQKTAIVLGDLRAKSALPALEAELKKPDEGLKAANGVSGHQSVILAIGLIGGPDASKTLLAILDDAKQNNKLRAAAAEALNATGDVAALPSLLKIANEKFIDKMTVDAEKGALVAAAVTSYSRLADADHASVTLQKVPDEIADMREVFDNAGARLTVAKQCKKDLACYSKLLSDKDNIKAEKAALMLTRMGKDGLKELLKAVGTPDPAVRMTVLFGISQDGGPGCGECKVALEKQIEVDESKPPLRGLVDEMRAVLALVSRG